MNLFFKKNWIWLVAIVLSWVTGFFMGRSKTDVIVKPPVYVKGEKIIDSIPVPFPEPYEVIVPQPYEVKLPMKSDTIRLPGRDSFIVQKVDTAVILSDYVKENRYHNVLFDVDTLGKMQVNTSVQYNKLKNQVWEFTPVYKKETVERRRIFTPFVTGSFNSINQGGAGVGFYIKNVGVGAKYVKDFSLGKEAYEGALYIKF